MDNMYNMYNNNMSNIDQFYRSNPNVKRDGAVIGFTQEQIQEYVKCSQDPAYFARKYCKVINLDRGLVPFDLYPYQEKMFEHFNNERFTCVLACRQSGKSISSVAYLLWNAVFHPDQTIAILANKGETAREMLGRITLMLENLPFFLQPGTKVLNKGSIEFSNNSRIVARPTSGASIRGMSVNLLYLDEFAFVEDAATFYTSTYPVITSGSSTKVIITSTANGIGNMYHKIWEGAIQGTNEFKPFRVDWWDVPGRDEKWKLQTIANTSQLQFDQEFGNTFFGTGDTLISGEALMKLKMAEPIRILEDRTVRIYEEVKKDHDYVMAVDVAKGVGGDYSTFNIIDITQKPFKQVATYQNNKVSPILFPDYIHKYAKVYNNAWVLIENNDQGGVVCNGMYYDYEYENLYVQSAVKATGLGITMDRKVKRLGCSNIKDLIEGGKLEIVDRNTILEISTFVAKGQSYEAADGNHDDLMMNLVLFGYFTGLSAFGDMTDINVKKFLFEQQTRHIEDDVVPFGFIDDGSDPDPEPIVDPKSGWSVDKDWRAEQWDTYVNY